MFKTNVFLLTYFVLIVYKVNCVEIVMYMVNYTFNTVCSKPVNQCVANSILCFRGRLTGKRNPRLAFIFITVSIIIAIIIFAIVLANTVKAVILACACLRAGKAIADTRTASCLARSFAAAANKFHDRLRGRCLVSPVDFQLAILLLPTLAIRRLVHFCL